MPPVRVHLSSLVEDFDKRGQEVAIVATQGVREHRTSYRELSRLSRRFACELQRRGIAKGDRVLLWGRNSAFWTSAFFGCLLNGSLPVPIDMGSTGAFVSALIADVVPKLIVAADELASSLPLDVPVLSLSRWPTLVTNEIRFVPPERAATDALQIVFTSGTTGQPKGIVHTHANVLANLRPIEQEMGKYLKFERPFHPIRILHTLPLSHVFGQFMGLWVPPLLGAEIHFEDRLVAGELVEYIARKRISVLAAVPRVLDLLQSYLLQRFPNLSARLAAAPGRKAIARWWHFRDVHAAFGFKFWAFVCGGASLSSSSEQFWSGLGFVVIQGYGMTETTALVSLNHPFKLARGTMGQVLPGREVRLSEQGEVLVRGETISNTTWQNGRLQQADSDWLATGDLADIDEGGNLHFRGRLKDVIVTASGLNIYPEDLEAALLKQPGVKACSVIEVAGSAGPEPLAAVVLSDGYNASVVVQAANHVLAEFQHLQRWIEWPEPDLPRTSTGKILRREIARRVASGEITPSLSTEVLNLDSLGRVQLQAQLEAKFGVALDDDALQQVRTEADVRQLLTRGAVSAGRTELLEHAYPRWPWSRPVQFLRSVFLEVVAMPLVRLLAKPRIHLTQPQTLQTPLLLVANHVTSYDAPLILSALPRHVRRRVAIAMSAEMIRDWRLGRNQGHWLLNLIAPLQYFLVAALFNNFPLPQLSGFRRSFRHAGEAVDAGYSVLVFPEGRRAEDDRLQPFKSGAGLLWKELGIPALPLYLGGLGEIKSQHNRWLRTGEISVSVGPVLLPPPNELPFHLAQTLQNAISSLELHSKLHNLSANQGKFAEPD